MEKKQIYMDLDGVLVDFVEGYQRMFGRNAYKDDPFTITQFCLTEPNFFRKLTIHPQGYELFNMLKNRYHIIFLTTPMKGMNNCRRDKVEWVRENIGDYDVYFSDKKYEYVTDNESILIDDMGYNLEPWRDAGGTAIQFPQKLDRIMDIIEETFNPTREIKKITRKMKEIDVNTEPTEKQKESGNYKKGIIDFKGLTIAIENPKGSVRWGFDKHGQKWISKMKHAYGYIKGSEGADFDPVDCFIGPHLNKSLAFVVNQKTEDNLFDEHKIMLGFDSEEEATTAYLDNYQKGWEKNIHSVVQTNTKKIREWLKSGDTLGPYK